MATSAVVLLGLSALLLCGAQKPSPVTELEIYQMHIRSDITFRFATTLVSARLKNHAQEAREMEFSVTLPESAFISNFSMTIDGELFYGKVKPKKVAKKEYTEARERGESAATIIVKSLDSGMFTVNVNVAAQANVNFNLTYQELLLRRLGLYEHLVNINPGQVVPNLRLDVFIRESHAITELKTPPMRQITKRFQLTQPGDNPLAVIERLSPTDAHVSYVPSMAHQIHHGNNGLNQQFILQYDVARESSTGELQVVNGYFVHFFAPDGLDPINKDICFVIDVSESMSGSKIRQTKEAMTTILDDLRPGDRFTIIKFHSRYDVWPSGLVTPKSIEQAKHYVNNLSAGGMTNINNALQGSIRLMISTLSQDTSRPAIIIFLTDGDPTSGVIHKPTIASNLRNANLGRVSVFSLGFGEGLDFNFLRKLSLQNRGFARKIYDGAAATVQLEGFYNEISSPVMANVKFTYLGDSVDQESITNTDLGTLFDGTEFVVAGRLNNDVTSVPYNIFGGSAQGNISLSMKIQTTDAERRARELQLLQFTERLWAYLTIRRILDKMVAAENMVEKEQLEQRATEMSLKYGFVTPLTSMVVTEPREPISNHRTSSTILDELPVMPPNNPSRQRQVLNPYRQSTPGAFYAALTRSYGVHRSLPRQPFIDRHRQPVEVVHALYAQLTSYDVPEFHPMESQFAHRGSIMRRGWRGSIMIPVAPTRRPLTRETNPPTVVANDHHFVINITGIEDQMCFDIVSTSGTVYKLVYDYQTAITVNGRMVAPLGLRDKTFLGKISFLHHRHSVRVTPSEIIVRNRSYRWSRYRVINIRDGNVAIIDKTYVDVTYFGNVTFRVQRYVFRTSTPGKVDYLGFYIKDGTGLSPWTHGLVGQFQHQRASMRAYPSHDSASSHYNITIQTGPNSGQRVVTAHLKRQRYMDNDAPVDCWYIPNNGAGILEGHHRDYIVPDLQHNGPPLFKNR